MVLLSPPTNMSDYDDAPDWDDMIEEQMEMEMGMEDPPPEMLEAMAADFEESKKKLGTSTTPNPTPTTTATTTPTPHPTPPTPPPLSPSISSYTTALPPTLPTSSYTSAYRSAVKPEDLKDREKREKVKAMKRRMEEKANGKGPRARTSKVKTLLRLQTQVTSINNI